jgi:cysteine desulfurase
MIGGALAKRKEGRNEIVLSSIEHHALLSSAERLEKAGFIIRYLPVNEGGMVELNVLKSALRADTGIVAVMAANNETGVKQPVRDLAKLAHENGSLFFTDAVQYAPYGEIDVKAWGVDLLSISSHKFYGPKGCGVLYLKNGVKIEKYVQGGEQERGLRGGTSNVPCIVGMAAAYQKTCKEMVAANEKMEKLRTMFLQGLKDLGGVHINGDLENATPSIVNLRFDGVNNVDFLYNMDLKGICVSAGSACSSASIQPSHVLTAMGLSAEQVRSSVRFGFGKNNTQEEIIAVIEAVKETVLRLRKM